MTLEEIKKSLTADSLLAAALRPVLDDYHRHFATGVGSECGACQAIEARILATLPPGWCGHDADAMEGQWVAHRADVARMEAEFGRLREALALANSMIRSGERHSAQSEAIFSAAFAPSEP